MTNHSNILINKNLGLKKRLGKGNTKQSNKKILKISAFFFGS